MYTTFSYSHWILVRHKSKCAVRSCGLKVSKSMKAMIPSRNLSDEWKNSYLSSFCRIMNRNWIYTRNQWGTVIAKALNNFYRLIIFRCRSNCINTTLTHNCASWYQFHMRFIILTNDLDFNWPHLKVVFHRNKNKEELGRGLKLNAREDDKPTIW